MAERETDKPGAGRSARARRVALTEETADELGILDRAKARELTDTIARSYADGGRMVRKIIRKSARAAKEID